MLHGSRGSMVWYPLKPERNLDETNAVSQHHEAGTLQIIAATAANAADMGC